MGFDDDLRVAAPQFSSTSFLRSMLSGMTHSTEPRGEPLLLDIDPIANDARDEATDDDCDEEEEDEYALSIIVLMIREQLG